MQIINYEDFRKIGLGLRQSKGVNEYINEEGFPEWIHHYFKDDVYSYMKTVEIIQNIIDMDIVEWLDILNITLEEFANNYGVPFRTAQDWKLENTHLKGYFKDLLCYTVYTKVASNDGIK